jgi:SAM-dependent methyltransferase
MDVYSDWTTQFFSGLAVEFWDGIAPAPSETEIEFLRSVFGNANEILDVACGSGRFTIPLAAAGYRLTGIDISDDFLALAKHRAPSIEWHQGDIRGLPWVDRFDAAMCFGNSFGYFDREDTQRFLSGLARALRPGAAFVMETGASAESLLPSLQRERTIETADIIFSSTNRYDPRESRLDIEYSFQKGARREVRNAQTFVFTTGEIVALLDRAGFALEHIYASAARDEFSLGLPRAIFVARLSSHRISAIKKGESS